MALADLKKRLVSPDTLNSELECCSSVLNWKKSDQNFHELHKIILETSKAINGFREKADHFEVSLAQNVSLTY